MDVFKTKEFARFARRERISDTMLCAAIARAERGVIDADLGSGLIKQRLPRRGQGRSGGYRTVVAYGQADRAVFLHGFAKSVQDNLSANDEAALRLAAPAILALDHKQVEALVKVGNWKKVDCDV